jgi:hypothetical protein
MAPGRYVGEWAYGHQHGQGCLHKADGSGTQERSAGNGSWHGIIPKRRDFHTVKVQKMLFFVEVVTMLGLGYHFFGTHMFPDL